MADAEDDSDKESYVSKKKQKQSQLIQEHKLRPPNLDDDTFANKAFKTSWQQIQKEMIEVTSKRKKEKDVVGMYTIVRYGSTL